MNKFIGRKARKTASLVLAIIVISSLFIFTGTPVSAASPQAKNVIVMISDGMGFNHMLITDYYQYGQTGQQVYQSFPVKLACSTFEYEAADLAYPYSPASPYPTENPSYQLLGYDPALAWTDFNYARWMENPYDGALAPYRNNSTDSASAGSAIATGHKSKDGNIGVNINGEAVQNIAEYAADMCKAAGVVTSVSVSHATPASFSTHNISRSMYADLANGMLFDSDLTVVMGCGAPDHDNNGQFLGEGEELDPRLIGGPDTWAAIKTAWAPYDAAYNDWLAAHAAWASAVAVYEAWEAAYAAYQQYLIDNATWEDGGCIGDPPAVVEDPGPAPAEPGNEPAAPDFPVLDVPDKDDWTIVRSIDDFVNMAEKDSADVPERVLGLPFAYDTLQWQRDPSYYDPDPPYTVPFNDNVASLQQMTEAALNVLSVNGGDEGFFLMVEGGAVDWGGHFFTPGRMIEEMIEFNHTVEAVVDWIEANGGWAENLLVITADHETGYLWGPGSGMEGDPDPWKPVVNNGKGVMPDFEYNSTIYAWDEETQSYIPSFWWHTNSLVPVFARGAGADLFYKYATGWDTRRGAYFDNTDFVKVFLEAYGADIKCFEEGVVGSRYDNFIELNENGWSLISTDGYLEPGMCRFEGSVSMVYRHTPAGYLTTTLADLTPVDAFYVKTSGWAYAAFNKDKSVFPGASTKYLAEGWNLVSSGSNECASNVLSPLRYIQIGDEQGSCLATLVSQGACNLFSGDWYIDATVWSNLGNKFMSPFDGYWVYMNAGKTFGVIPGGAE